MLLTKEQECHVVHGDCIMEMARMPEESIDFSVFSPPFFLRSMHILPYQMT